MTDYNRISYANTDVIVNQKQRKVEAIFWLGFASVIHMQILECF